MNSHKLLRVSVLLFAANILTGLLNYAFQIYASKALGIVDFGSLNKWMTYLSIFLAVVFIGQVASNFFFVTEKKIKKLSVGIAIISLVTIIGLVLLLLLDRQLPGTLIALIAIVFSLIFSSLVGQFQVRTWFGMFGLTFFISALAKCVLPLIPFKVAPLSVFMTAFAVAPVVGCLWMALFWLSGIANESTSHNDSKTSITSQSDGIASAANGASPKHSIKSSVFIGVMTTVIPLIDFMNISQMHPTTTVGMYSRATLFSKATYFGIVTVLQITLPYHIRACTQQLDILTANRIRRLERLALTVGYSASLAYYWAMPIAAQILWNDPMRKQVLWVVASSANMTTLYLHLRDIQINASRRRWTLTTLSCCLLLGLLTAPFVLHRLSVQSYLWYAFGYYIATYFALRLACRYLHASSEPTTI
jgi:O-antigen/teichoic acid export membrane protein